MKLKIKITTFLFILLLSVSAYAQEDTYIVRFNDSMQLFSAKEKQGINYTVATEEELREYIEAGIVEDYEPNYEVVAIETNAEEVEGTIPEVKPNWNFDMVNAAFAYNIGTMGNEVKVAVIDSGLHSDDMIRAQILNGYDFIKNEETDEKVDNDNTKGGYHGTLVSSIIARQNVGSGTGIAARAHIMPLRALDYDETEQTNTGTLDNVIAAIKYAINEDCDVINMSIGIKGSDISKENLSTLSMTINEAV
ncbi:MAG: S8 family serine peptidase, partial [Clostridia bacterium]|nr:S8 family serine peptidase [Clostridia bacterium]